VITVLQASGGCGATTIAANLAAEIAGVQPPQDGPSTVVMDLDCCYGALTTYFGLAPLYAMDHLLHYDRALDSELIRSTATVANPQLHLLASPASTQGFRPQNPDFARLGQVLHVTCRTYHNTIIDAPRLPAEAVATLVQNSTHVLLVFQLLVKDVRARAGDARLARRAGPVAQPRGPGRQPLRPAPADQPERRGHGAGRSGSRSCRCAATSPRGGGRQLWQDHCAGVAAFVLPPRPAGPVTDARAGAVAAR
jgi:hypothetical protein